jgi:hypothetical protein
MTFPTTKTNRIKDADVAFIKRTAEFEDEVHNVDRPLMALRVWFKNHVEHKGITFEQWLVQRASML